MQCGQGFMDVDAGRAEASYVLARGTSGLEGWVKAEVLKVVGGLVWRVVVHAHVRRAEHPPARQLLAAGEFALAATTAKARAEGCDAVVNDPERAVVESAGQVTRTGVFLGFGNGRRAGHDAAHGVIRQDRRERVAGTHLAADSGIVRSESVTIAEHSSGQWQHDHQPDV